MARNQDPEKLVWCVAYINSDYLAKVRDELNSYNNKYKGIESFIPTVSVLKKTFKGVNEFSNIPLLFNYGFFKMPSRLASNAEFLKEMRGDISCLFSWVSDICKTKYEGITYSQYIRIATATNKEVANLIKSQKNLDIYSKDDIDSLQPGNIITLKGYPFDDLEAEVVQIRKAKREVKVRLIMGDMIRIIDISFDNVFYTIYQGGYLDKPLKEKSIEELGSRGTSVLDKLYSKNQ